MRVTSHAFKEGDTIPARYTCSGANISPPLAWTGVPDLTASLAIICEDPDAPSGIWTHWVYYNLPTQTPGLPEGIPKQKTLEDGAVQGLNSAKTIGYDGPCPPPGSAHRYFYKVFALDMKLPQRDNLTREQLLQLMEGHILGQGEVMGRFGR